MKIGKWDIDVYQMARMIIMSKNVEMSIPFPVMVIFTHTEQDLIDVIGRDNIGAHSYTPDKIDENGMGGYIFMSLERAYLSVLAHEVAHIALFHHGDKAGRKPANRYLWNHPESLAEMIGNMTALYWYRLTEEGIELT